MQLYTKEITKEQVLKAPPVTEPLGLYDCCPTTDGAAALILCKAELAEKRFNKKDYIIIDGMGLSCATGYITTAFNPKFKFTGFEATQHASKQAYEQAGIENPLEEIEIDWKKITIGDYMKQYVKERLDKSSD